MSSYQIIGLLGLALGLAACGVMFWEYFRPLNRKKLMQLGGLTLLGVLLADFGLIRAVGLLADYGQPGLSVLGTEAAGGLTIATLATIIGLILAFAVLMRGGKEAELAHRTASSPTLPWTHRLVLLIRIYICILFVFSGFVKANDYIGFSYKLEEYFVIFGEYLPFMAGFWKFWGGLAEPLAWFISVFEIALAVAILIGWRMRLTALLTLIMMLFFTFLTGFSAVTGKVTDCGCFGDALKLAPWESFTKDLIYMVMLVPLFLIRKHIKPIPNNKITTIITAAVFLISGIYSWYCHENLPLVDYRAYKIGTDLNVCTTQAGPDGIPKCKDWEEIYRLGDNFPILQGKTLMLVMYDMEKTSEEGLKGTVELTNSLTDTTIQVIAMTATGKSRVDEFIAKFNLPYSFSFRDQTMLKTIVRSNPAYVLMKDGVVLGKWHHNNAPSVGEIEGMIE